MKRCRLPWLVPWSAARCHATGREKRAGWWRRPRDASSNRARADAARQQSSDPGQEEHGGHTAREGRGMFEHGAGGEDGGDPDRPERQGRNLLPKVGVHRHDHVQRSLAAAAVQEKNHGAIVIVAVCVRMDPVVQTRRRGQRHPRQKMGKHQRHHQTAARARMSDGRCHGRSGECGRHAVRSKRIRSWRHAARAADERASRKKMQVICESRCKFLALEKHPAEEGIIQKRPRADPASVA